MIYIYNKHYLFYKKDFMIQNKEVIYLIDVSIFPIQTKKIAPK